MATTRRPAREIDSLADVRGMPGGDRTTQARVLGDRRGQHLVDPGCRPREGLTGRGGLSMERFGHRSGGEKDQGHHDRAELLVHGLRDRRLPEGVEPSVSQEQLAEQAELHWTYISGIERGQRSPTLNTLGRLARALGLPVSRLVSGLTDSDASPAAPTPKRPR